MADEFEDRNDEAGERKVLASRWQQYSATTQGPSATLTKVGNPKRRSTVGNLWWNKGSPPHQATLALKRGPTDMNTMFSNLKQHPLAVGSDGKSNWMMLDGKVNAQSKADQHESVYNVKLTTILGFNLTVGYSRFKDPGYLASTHAWVAFGDHCTFLWQRELGVILLLNIVGYKAYFPTSPSRWQVKGSMPPTPPPPASTPPAALTSACWSQPSAGGSIASSAAPKRATRWVHTMEEDEKEVEEARRLSAGVQRMHIEAAPAETQPLAGTASPQTQPVPPPPTQPLASTAFPQTQPRQTQPSLVLQAPPPDDDTDDNDYEGLDSRAAVGEQSFEEETAQAERQHQGDLQGEDSDRDSEAEERAFKAKVAAGSSCQEDARAKKVCNCPTSQRPAVVPAVGGDVAVLDWDVHQSAKAAKDMGRCHSFLTPAPAVGGDVADDDDEHWFVAAQNFDAQTRKHDIISDIMDNKEATTPSAQGDRVSGWCLVDELPDPDWPSRTGTSCPGSPGSP